MFRSGLAQVASLLGITILNDTIAETIPSTANLGLPQASDTPDVHASNLNLPAPISENPTFSADNTVLSGPVVPSPSLSEKEKEQAGQGKAGAPSDGGKEKLTKMRVGKGKNKW